MVHTFLNYFWWFFVVVVVVVVVVVGLERPMGVTLDKFYCDSAWAELGDCA
jgi:hypothetical protein